MKRGPLAAAEASFVADRKAADPAIWITRVPDAAVLDRARQLEREGPMGRPLWGLTVAVKDNIDVAGLPTTAGCPGYARTPDETAPAAARLLEAGALLLGKTNLDQFATGLVGTRSPYGTPRNLFGADRIPGGSSSGSGIAVGAGIVDIALGTDTAGSGRVPAAFSNIVGLKPTVGSVSATGIVPACRSLDTVSMFARTVDAALRAHRVIAGYDAADPYSRAAPAGYLRRAAFPEVARIAVADVDALCGPEINLLWRRAAGLFACETIDASLLLDVARLLYDGPWVAERASALRDVLTTRPEIMHPVTRAIIESGMNRKTVDAFDAFHAVRRARRMLAELFARCDALLLPTVPCCPTLAEVAADPFEPNRRLGWFTNFVNLCDLAAFAVPAGIGADGLPVGVTVLGPAWSEGRIAAIADHIHRAFTADLPPPSPPDALAEDETALFCVGAHMSGLSLNHQLTERGGRLLRVARTLPVYRLHALGNRPGMARGPGGAAIAGEVWALPTAAIGALLALVPAPLGFGAVALEDGDCLGFLAEAEALAGTRDITAFGGWRAWLAQGATAGLTTGLTSGLTAGERS
jgi:allophanate hydrolase